MSEGGGSGDLKETVQRQERLIVSLRGDLSARSQVINKVEAKCREITQRLADVEALLANEREAHAYAVASLEAVKEAHVAELGAREAAWADDVAHQKHAHAEEIARLERAHEEAAALSAKRDLALRERDEARSALEVGAMDLAQVQIDLAEQTRGRSADARKHADELAERDRLHREALEALELAHAVAGGTASASIQAELAETKSTLAETLRALDAAEREAIQQQLARDAAFHDMHVKAAADRDAAVEAAKSEAATEREELVRAHEHAFATVRDTAVSQALSVLRKEKKRT